MRRPEVRKKARLRHALTHVIWDCYRHQWFPLMLALHRAHGKFRVKMEKASWAFISLTFLIVAACDLPQALITIIAEPLHYDPK